MLLVFVFTLFFCGSLADSKSSCSQKELIGVDKLVEHGKEFLYDCSLGNIQRKQFVKCDDGNWLRSPCFGKIAI